MSHVNRDPETPGAVTQEQKMNDTDRDINSHTGPVFTPYEPHADDVDSSAMDPNPLAEDYPGQTVDGPTVHNPTHFEPKDYVVEDYLDNKRPEFFGQGINAYEEEVKLWEADMLRALGTNWRAKSHRCVHCGNGTVRWITACLHVPTGERVVFGAVCTERLGFENRVAFKLAQLQARAESRKVRFTIWTKRQAFIAANPTVAEALEAVKRPEHAKNFFVIDVLAKLDRYGDLSVRQVEAVAQSLRRDVEMAAKRAAEATEPKGDAPSGRQTVTGVVLSAKFVENDFGVTKKMLVKLENNSKVWLTCPAREDIERDDTVTFAATFEVSRDDKSFGFGKRPHVVKVVKAGRS